MSPLPVSYDAGATTSSPAAAEVVSVSTIAATTVATGHLVFKLEGYSRLKARHGENGSYIESSVSKVGGHAWKIRCYLNGHGKDDAGFVSLFLCLCRDATGPAHVHAEYQFDLLPHQGTSPEKVHLYKPRTRTLRTFGFGDEDVFGWGPLKFISVEELERSMFLKEDCLAVRCTVTVVRERTVKEKAVQAEDLARLGMLCKCDDDLCKRHHARPAAETFLESFAKLCYSICRGHPGR